MSYDQTGWSKILIMCGVKDVQAAQWAPYCATIFTDSLFDGGHEELAQFLGQCLHETGLLTVMSENLNYTVAALTVTFGSSRISAVDAKKYGRIDGSQVANQQAIANIVYGGAWGLKNLGNKNPTDGWDYRGSGWIQTTGAYNFGVAEKHTDIPFVSQPNRMRAISADTIEASVAWWHSNITVDLLSNSLALRKRVNGAAALGYEDCVKLTQLARNAMAAIPESPEAPA